MGEFGIPVGNVALLIGDGSDHCVQQSQRFVYGCGLFQPVAFHFALVDALAPGEVDQVEGTDTRFVLATGF